MKNTVESRVLITDRHSRPRKSKRSFHFPKETDVNRQCGPVRALLAVSSEDCGKTKEALTNAGTGFTEQVTGELGAEGWQRGKGHHSEATEWHSGANAHVVYVGKGT